MGHAGHTGGTTCVLRIYSGSFSFDLEDLDEQTGLTSSFSFDKLFDELSEHFSSLGVPLVPLVPLVPDDPLEPPCVVVPESPPLVFNVIENASSDPPFFDSVSD